LTNSGPRWISRLFGENQRAIASLFKVYVLGAVSQVVRNSDANWDDPITIQDDLKSLPNGDFRNLPSGTTRSARVFAEQMIAASDNTATDHLIAWVGREVAQDAFAQMGHGHADQNVPLLFTREWFAMRMKFRDTQMERYLSASEANRLRILDNTVQPIADALTEADPWPGPRFIDSVEWFAGASDIVRALDWHRSQGDQAAMNSLSLNPGICWHPDDWTYVGYKGGYETGVMSNAWLLQRTDGRWFAFAGIINNTRSEIDAPGFWQLLAVAERLLQAES
jgi:hypothetical protein